MAISEDLQAGRLQTLTEISRVLSSTLDLHTLYDTIYQQIGRVMDTSQFYIALHDSVRNIIDVPYHREDDRLVEQVQMPYGGSVTYLVIERGLPLLFHTEEDYSRFAAANDVPQQHIGQARSEAKIFVPLNTGSRTIGALSVQSRRIRAFTQDDVQTLLIIAAQAAIAIDNARLFEETRQSVREMHALLEVARGVTASLRRDNVLDAILQGMRQVVPFHLATVLLPNGSQGCLDIAGTVGPLPEERRTVQVPVGRGVTGRVYATGEALMVEDVHAFVDYIRGSNEAASELAVPLRFSNRIVGVLDLERTEKGAFSQHDLDLLTVFASQAAVAIENARLYSREQRHVYELQRVQNIMHRLTPQHDMAAIAQVVVQELHSLIDYTTAVIWLLDPIDHVLVPLASCGMAVEGITLAVGEGVTGKVVAQGESIWVTNMRTDPRVKHLPGRERQDESMISVPLIYERRVQGVITVTKLGANRFDENALRLLEIIGGQVGLALDRARLYEELRTQAITDALTRLYNFRYLHERFAQERSSALRNQYPLSAIIVDVDKFKSINDTYGHDAGNVVLRCVAARLRATVRMEDIVARQGGEEFAILLPRIDLEEATVVAERLRRMIAERELPAAAGRRHVTVSVGVAALRPSDHGSEVLSRADQAMYQAKAEGNRVAVSGSESQ